MREKQSELSTARTAGLSYAGLGAVFGFAASVITFIACWTYCITAYDVVLGVGFGWIPAALCAGIIGWSVFFLWGGAVLFLVIAGVFVVAAASNPNMVIALAIGGLVSVALLAKLAASPLLMTALQKIDLWIRRRSYW